MPTFTNGYTEPGTYVTIKDVPIPNTASGSLTAAFTGTGKTVKSVSETVTLTRASTADPFIGTVQYFPVISWPTDETSGFTVVTDVYGTQRLAQELVNSGGSMDTLVEQFSVDSNTGTITWGTAAGVTPPPADPLDTTGAGYLTTTITITGYTVTKTAIDYEPKVFSSKQAVFDEYGELTELKTLSIAAETFFTSTPGGQIYCVQVTEDTVAGHQAAIAKLATVDAYCVVPLIEANATTNASLITTLKNHVIQMSATTERRERIGLLSGFSSSESITVSTDTATETHISAIRACNHERLGYVVPSACTATLNSIDVTSPGWLTCASLAGIIVNPATTCGEPISGKTIAGITAIPDRYTRFQKNKMAASGGLVIENQFGVPMVRHALSTNPVDIVKAELKITRIKDVISRTCRTTLDALFINKRNTGAEFLADVKTTTQSLLNSFITSQDITDYSNLSVVVDGTDPRQINVAFQIRPTWDVNWVWVKFGVTR